MELELATEFPMIDPFTIAMIMSMYPEPEECRSILRMAIATETETPPTPSDSASA
jgi:hypothetical protein